MQPQMQQQPLMQQQQPQMSQQHVSQNPGVTFITHNQPEMVRNKLQPSALSKMKGLSITQIVMAGLCVISGITLIALDSSYAYDYKKPTDGFAYSSYGIWSGLYFVLVGGIGLGAVRYNTSRWIVSAMILNILCSAIFFLPLLILCAVGLGITSSKSLCMYSYGYSYTSADCGLNPLDRASLAFNSLLLLISIAELVITIWSAVLCCGAACDCCYTSPRTQVVQYHTAPGVQTRQQFVMCSGVPATTAYAVCTSGYQISVQNQSPAYPVAVHQQPSSGYVAQPQEPPSYFTATQTAPPQSSEQAPPPTAYPNDPQHPIKHQQ